MCYVEITPEGLNIMCIPTEMIEAITNVIECQVKLPDGNLTKDNKRFLRQLSKMIDYETSIQVWREIEIRTAGLDW